MRLAALISGGKDSLYAAYLATQDGHEIKYLITFISENPDSYMFHTPNIHLTELISQSMGIPLIKVYTKGEKEKEIEDIRKVLANLGVRIDGITCGAIASSYQMKRIEDVASDLGLACVAPLWKKDQAGVLRDEVGSGFDVIIIHVAAGGFLDSSWLGKKLDSSCISELIEKRLSPVGEGGEFETLVLDCPLYRKRLVVEESEKVWDKTTQSGTFVVKRATLADR